MKKRRFVMAKISDSFKKELDEIKINRRLSVDRKFSKELATERITDGITRCAEWKIIKKKLMKEPRKEDLGIE